MTKSPLIVLTSRVFPETRAALERVARIVANENSEPWSRDEVIERCREASGLMAFMTDRIDRAFLERCPRLKVIGAALKGYDNIDVDAANERGVQVTIVPDLLTEPTAELAIGLMIALGRHIPLGDVGIRHQGFAGWRPQLYGTGIGHSTVGIVGFGLVGQAIARRLRGFGCRIVAFDTRPIDEGAGVERAAFDDVLKLSDFVVLGLPLTETTTGLIDAKAIARMKPGALLVNPARGSLVEEAAVADALESGHLGGYAADVFECEDWARPQRPMSIDARLTAPGARTVLTPHIGSAVTSARRQIELSTANSILQALAGQLPAGLVNIKNMKTAALTG
ncbi:MAG: phosphonate dehydrogenase [Bradyrhizobium sp.]|uniref:phosphonate dehydrogenase n=1 Tax=Bradyrhizobium sp. TaxID=376 RepID=UPI00271DB413|nr:phosphonate dehydrogenase [Bradyrhizobium sp.]MDO8397950.1 phosphonate dehydrogenase [Bradyrhizobium sp.]